MDLFTKKCKLCHQKLVDNRTFREVCDNCGGTYQTLLHLLAETEKTLNENPDPLICYGQCLIGLGFVDQIEPFLAAGFSSSNPDNLRRLFANKARSYAVAVAKTNEKKPYESKVGIPPISHAKNLQTVSPILHSRHKRCKACWGPGPLNSAGYCYTCIRRATSFTKHEMEAFAKSHSVQNMSEHQWQLATLDWKLGKIK